MKKIKFLPFLLLLSLCGTAPAAYATLISGDANSLHAEFSIAWEPYSGGVSYGSPSLITGTWEGGSYTFSYAMSVLQPLSTVEIRESFSLRTIWNDGWNPGSIFTQQIATVSGGHNIDLGTYPYLATDFSGNNLLYYLDVHATQYMTLSGDFTGAGGQGLVTWDLSRTPYNVPDTGSTLAMFGMALVMLGGGKILRNYRRGAA